MKITAPAGALTRALSFVSRAAARAGTTQPTLTSALFEADEEQGVLRIAATDTELTARIASGAPRIEEGGRAALPCRMLHDIVKALDAGTTVRLETGGSEAALATEDAKNTYSLRLMEAVSFPELAAFPEEGSFTLGARKLAEAISSVAPTASTDASHPVLTGVLLAFRSDGATLVATDSYRMALYSGKLEGAPEEGKAIIPAKSLREVARLCSMGPERIEVAITESAAMFRAGGPASGVTLSTRLISGQFPDHTKLMPEGAGFAKEYIADAAALTDALGRVSLFAKAGAASQSSGPPVPVALDFSEKPEAPTLEGQASVGISVVSKEVGSGAESVPVTPAKESSKDGEGMEVSFNPEYLMGAVRTCREAGSDKILFRLNGPLKPAMIEPEGDSPVKVMLMPMRNPNSAAKDGSNSPQKEKAAAASEG